MDGYGWFWNVVTRGAEKERRGGGGMEED